MNPLTGEIVYGDAEVIDRAGKKAGTPLVPLPDDLVTALQRMSYGQRMEWLRANRPGLTTLVESGMKLTAAQQKALTKKERKRQDRLAARGED